MILNQKPDSAVLINSNSKYTFGGLSLNENVALNLNTPLGGRDNKIGHKPDSAIYHINSPFSALLINSNSHYSNNNISLNEQISLNDNVSLGGRDILIGQKPDSALRFVNSPFNGVIKTKYNITNIQPVGQLVGQPMGLLLCLTYP